MSLEQNIADLVTATTSLTEAVNVKKQNLDEAVIDAQNAADSVQIKEQEREQIFEDAQDERENEFSASQIDKQNRFNDFIASSGYQFLGDYADDIEITEYNQIIRDSDGEFWRLSGQVELPYTTTGAGLPEDDALIPAGDAVLRQDLANPDTGAALIGTRIYANDAIALTQQERINRGVITPYDFGAVGDGITDDTEAVQKFFSHIAQKECVASICGTFLVTDTIYVGTSVTRATATQNIDCAVTFISRINIHDKKPTVFFEGIEKTKFTGTIRITGVWTLIDRSEPSVYDGFEFGRFCAGAQFDVLRVEYAHRWALLAERGQIGGGVVIGGFHAERCGFTNLGSDDPAAGTYTLTSVRDDPSNDNRSIVTFGGNLLPVGFGDTSYMVSVKGDHPDDDDLERVYEVLSYDEVTGEATIYPRIDHDFGLGRPMRVGHGGGCFHRGVGPNRWNYLNFNCQSVSVGFVDQQAYGTNFYNLHIAQAVIPGVHGSTTRPITTGTLNHVYIEGNGILRGFVSFHRNIAVTVNQSSLLDRYDCFMVPPMVPDPRLGLKRLPWGGIFLDSPKSGTPAHNSEVHVTPLNVAPKGLSIQAVIRSYSGSASKTVRLLKPSPANLVNGYTSIVFVVLSPSGDGVGGTLTVEPWDGATVNGDSTASYSMDAFRIYWCFYDPNEDNWTVNFTS